MELNGSDLTNIRTIVSRRSADPEKNSCGGEGRVRGPVMTSPTCVMCRWTAQKNDRWITDFPFTVAYLNEDQFFPGYSLLILKRHATELYHLARDERAGMIEEVSQVASALAAAFQPIKMNYELLGNQVPHIHWHLIPRLANDPLPSWPVWRVPHDPLHLSAERCRERVATIRTAIPSPM